MGRASKTDQKSIPVDDAAADDDDDESGQKNASGVSQESAVRS